MGRHLREEPPVNARDEEFRLLKPARVAELLGVNLDTLKHWRQERRHRELEFVRIGPNILRYRADSVRRFLKNLKARWKGSRKWVNATREGSKAPKAALPKAG
jgi:hypothetical protein